MINFERQYFQKLSFKEEQIEQFFKVSVLGNKMRQERNFNLYDGGFFVGEKDSREYLDFVKGVFKKADIKQNSYK